MEANFTPTASAALGDYDLRIMVNDTGGLSSGWSTYNDVITVTNNVPSLSNYGLSASSVLRSDTIVIGMNTTDIEDGEASSHRRCSISSSECRLECILPIDSTV